MKQNTRFTALALALTLGVSIVSLPVAARASEEGKRNTAIGIGVLAAGLLLTQKNKLPGLIAAGGAAYAYTQYDASVRDRHNREREYGYYNGDYRYDRNNNSYHDNRDRYQNGNRDNRDRYQNSNRDNQDRYQNSYEYGGGADGYSQNGSHGNGHNGDYNGAHQNRYGDQNSGNDRFQGGNYRSGNGYDNARTMPLIRNRGRN